MELQVLGCGRQVAAIPKRIVLTCVFLFQECFLYLLKCIVFVIVLVLGCGGSCILSDREHMGPVFLLIFYKVLNLKMWIRKNFIISEKLLERQVEHEGLAAILHLQNLSPWRFRLSGICTWGVGEGTRMSRVVASSVKVSLGTQPHLLPENGDCMWEIEDSEDVFQITLLLILRSTKHSFEKWTHPSFMPRRGIYNSDMEFLHVFCISDMSSGNCRYVISPPPYPVPQRGEGVNKELCMCYTLSFTVEKSMQWK
jgi:hypothetical protein